MTDNTGGEIRPPTSPDDDLIPVRLSGGTAWFPARDGTPLELGERDEDGNPSPAEEAFGADVLRRMNER